MLSTKPLRHELATRPGPGNRKLTYLSGDSVTRTLNDIFGFDGWCLEVKETKREACEKDQKGRYNVSYTSTVRLTHRISGAFKEDCGAGDAIDRSLGTAVSNALKGSVTDAMKRAARHFGDKLGNSLYESKFSMNNAPRTLTDALNQYDIDRAKTKFGFKKDQKPMIANKSSTSSSSTLSKGASPSNSISQTKSAVMKTSTSAASLSSNSRSTVDNSKVMPNGVKSTLQHQTSQQNQQKNSNYQYQNGSAAQANQQSKLNHVVQQQRQQHQQQQKQQQQQQQHTKPVVPSIPNSSKSLNNHAVSVSKNISVAKTGGLSRFQQPPQSTEKNSSQGMQNHNVYLQRQNQQQQYPNLSSNTSSISTTSKMVNSAQQQSTPIQSWPNKSLAPDSSHMNPSNNQNSINLHKNNIGSSTGTPGSQAQVLARPTSARGHSTTFLPSSSNENTNLNGKRVLPSSNNEKLQYAGKKPLKFTGTNNPYASRKI